MPDKLRVLLTGAGGTVGFEALKQLSEQRDKYYLNVFDLNTSKNRKKFSKFSKDINFIYGDISIRSDIEKACKNIDFAIHVAAIIPPLADDNPELAERVNAIGTKNLIECLEKHSPNAFICYSSSISVYGDRLKDFNIKIGDEIKPSIGDEYALTKIEAEKAIKNSKLDWSIFRLTAIMGGHKVSKLMFHMPLDTPMEICTPSDTARAFVNAIRNKDKISKKTYNLGGGKECRIIYQDFLSKSFKIYGLGEAKFPKNAFAEHNFHCGYYIDGDELESAVNFRKDTLDDYFEKEIAGVSGIQKLATKCLKGIIKKTLIKQSEPLVALRENDIELIDRFFVKKIAL